MRTTLLILFVHLSVCAFSQESRALKTVIVDAERSTVVEGATIKNLHTGEISFSNETGQFLLKKITNEDSLVITAIGYETKFEQYGIIVKTSGKIFLKQQPVLLQEMTIVSNAGQYNSVISKLDVKMRGISNSQEALRIVPGLFIGQHAGGGKAEQIFLRGFDVDHGTDVNISVDGMPVNMVSHAHGQGYADLHFVIPEIIETVQFKKGPYDASKANFETAGFVYFKKKTTLEKNTVKLEAGLFNTSRGLAMMNLLTPKNNGGQSLYIAAEYMKTRGYFDSPQNFNRFNFFTKYRTQLSNNNILSVTASTFSSKWNASGQIPSRAVDQKLISFFGAIDPNEGGQTARSNVNAQLISHLKNNQVFKQQLYFSRYDFELYSNFTFFLNDPVNGDQIRQKEKRNLFGYTVSYSADHYLGAKKLSSEFGAGLRYDKTANSELSHTKNRTEVLNHFQLGDVREKNSFAFINETLHLSPRFSVNTGLRLDQFNQGYKNEIDAGHRNKNNAAILSPKLNLFYRANDKMEIYLASGKGFHSNDTRVISQNIRSKILPAAYGTDLGINLKPTKNLFVNAAAWYLYLQQEFVYVGDEGIIEPNGKTKRIGIDVSVRYQPFNQLFLDADFNYAKARFIAVPKGGKDIPLAPMFTSSGGVGYKSEKGLSASIRYRYMGNRPANEENSVIAKGYFLTDAVRAYTEKKYEVNLNVQNVFDVRWKETQFETESRLQNEPVPVSEIHFTPGTPLFIKLGLSFFF